MKSYLKSILPLLFCLISCDNDDSINETSPPSLVSQIEREWTLQSAGLAINSYRVSSQPFPLSEGSLIMKEGKYELKLNLEFNPLIDDNQSTTLIENFSFSEIGEYEIITEFLEKSIYIDAIEYKGRIRFRPESGDSWVANYFYSDIYVGGDQVSFEPLKHTQGEISIMFLTDNL